MSSDVILDGFRLVSQFGVRRLLFWLREFSEIPRRLFGVSPFTVLFGIPARCVDSDGDGLCEEVVLETRTSLLSEGEIGDMKFFLDGKPVPEALVETGGREYRLGEISDENPLVMLPGEAMRVVLRGLKVRKGRHGLLIQARARVVTVPGGWEVAIRVR